MVYTLENEYLAIHVKQAGAELCGIRSQRTGLEYMWDAQPEVWANSAPVLFPVIGMMKNGGYYYKNQWYSMLRHGFARNNPNFVLTDDTHGLRFSLGHSPETLAMFPFEFRLNVNFTLHGQTVRVEHQVHNLGNETMYFSLGAHPAFRCPRHWGEAYSDYYLEFNQPENSARWQVGTQGLIGTKTTPFFDHTRRLMLDKELFAGDALVFKDLKSTEIALRSTQSQEVLTVQFDGFPYMGIWAKYGGNFVCIEPWQGIADSETATGLIEEKEGIIALAAGASHTATYSVRIAE